MTGKFVHRFGPPPYDPSGNSGDKGTPFIGRDDMKEWLRGLRLDQHQKPIRDAIIEFIDFHGRGGEG